VVARGIDYEYRTVSNAFTLVVCRCCATAFLNPRPRRHDLPHVYPANYYTMAKEAMNPLVRQAWRRLEKHRARFLRSLVGPGHRRVADVGCGDGRLLVALRNLGGEDWEVTGIDRGLSRALTHWAESAGVHLIDGWYEETPLEERTFDLIVAQQVIEHVVDPVSFLRKARRELAPGGQVVLDTPNYESLDRRLFAESYWGGYHFPRHLTLFSPNSIGELARRANLEVVTIRPLASPIFWIMTLHNLAYDGGAPAWLESRLNYRSFLLVAAATLMELPRLWAGQMTSNMRVVLRRRPH
jgi:2-polyprenyl-3-methyl-5-hydroxy-6-metoxy-1,4-benzoquinol methylase